MVSKDIFDVLTQNWSLLLSFDVTGKSCSYFTNITKGLNLRESTGNINFENEESCKKIKENFGKETISKKDVLNLIKQLPRNKATVSNDIPVSVLKESVSAYYEKLTDIFNNCIRSGTFPEIL